MEDGNLGESISERGVYTAHDILQLDLATALENASLVVDNAPEKGDNKWRNIFHRPVALTPNTSVRKYRRIMGKVFGNGDKKYQQALAVEVKANVDDALRAHKMGTVSVNRATIIGIASTVEHYLGREQQEEIEQKEIAPGVLLKRSKLGYFPQKQYIESAIVGEHLNPEKREVVEKTDYEVAVMRNLVRPTDKILVYYPSDLASNPQELEERLMRYWHKKNSIVEQHNYSYSEIELIIMPKGVLKTEYSYRDRAILSPQKRAGYPGDSEIHEMAHALKFVNSGGNSKTMQEGWAQWVERRHLLQSGKSAPELFDTPKYIVDVLEGVDVKDLPLGGEKFEEMARKKLGKRAVNDVLYSLYHKWGTFLVDALVEEYGPDALDQIYSLTSQNNLNLFSLRDGKWVILKGERLGTEEEILEAAIGGVVGGDPDKVRQAMWENLEIRKKILAGELPSSQ